MSLQFAEQNFLSGSVLEAVAASRVDLACTLADLGYVPREYADEIVHSSRNGNNAPAAPCDQYSHNARVVKAALCAGGPACT